MLLHLERANLIQRLEHCELLKGGINVNLIQVNLFDFLQHFMPKAFMLVL